MTIPPIDYSSRDFAALQADIIALAQTLMPEWTNITSPTDFGAVLIELFAYAGDVMSYYIDRIANEALLSTAQRRQTVLDIAKMFDYTPIASNPASGLVTFTLVNGAKTTTIPSGTQVSNTPSAGNSPIIFETNADLTINGSDSATPVNTNANGSVVVVQGVTIKNEVLSTNFDGTLNSTFSLFNPNVIAGSIVLTVSDAVSVVVWRETADLLDETASSQVFTTRVDDSNITTVQFGDGVFGAVPARGSVISVTYRTGGGVLGNLGTGIVNELVTPIAAVGKVSNANPMSGGTDAESIASMRVTIPKSLTALNRAITLSDFEALAVQVPGIAKASASATVPTQVNLRLAPVGADPVFNPAATGPFTQPGTLEYAVDQYLAGKKLINTSITYSDPVWDAVAVVATVYVLDNYSQTTVELLAINAVQDLFTFDNVDFGKSITVSQVYHAIQGVAGVSYCTLTGLYEVFGATPSGVQDITPLSFEIPYLDLLTLNMVGGVVV